MRHLLVADKAAIGNCNDTVNVKSDPVGNITDLFLLDFTTGGCIVWFLYLTEVSLASLKAGDKKLYEDVVLAEYEEWQYDTNRTSCMTKLTLDRTNADIIFFLS